jgi:hypothetical protein
MKKIAFAVLSVAVLDVANGNRFVGVYVLNSSTK